MIWFNHDWRIVGCFGFFWKEFDVSISEKNYKLQIFSKYEEDSKYFNVFTVFDECDPDYPNGKLIGFTLKNKQTDVLSFDELDEYLQCIDNVNAMLTELNRYVE